MISESSGFFRGIGTTGVPTIYHAGWQVVTETALGHLLSHRHVTGLIVARSPHGQVVVQPLECLSGNIQQIKIKDKKYIKLCSVVIGYLQHDIAYSCKASPMSKLLCLTVINQ